MGLRKKEGNTVKRQPKKTDQMQGLKGSKATNKGEQTVAMSSKVAPWLAKAIRKGTHNLKRLLKPERYSKDFMHLVKNYNPIRSVGMKLFLIFLRQLCYLWSAWGCSHTTRLKVRLSKMQQRLISRPFSKLQKSLTLF